MCVCLLAHLGRLAWLVGWGPVGVPVALLKPEDARLPYGRAAYHQIIYN